MLRCLIVFFVLVNSAYAVDLKWDLYEAQPDQNIILQILGTHDYPATVDSEWTVIHENIPVTKTTESVPIPLQTTTYSMRAVDINTGEKSGLSDITPDCVYMVDVVPEPAPPEPIIIPVEPEPEPDIVETPVEPLEPIVEDEPKEIDHTIGMIRLVDCRSTEDVNEIKLCGEINNDPYLMAESTKEVSSYIISIDYIEEFVEPYENNEFFYNLVELKYGISTFIINSDDDSISFAVRKSIEGEGIKYEIMVGDDDRFIDPLIIYMPVPPVNDGGGCFITTLF